MLVHPCLSCLRFRHGKPDGVAMSCEAFPAGIPDEIVLMQFDHRKPHPDDGGLMYVADAESAPATKGQMAAPFGSKMSPPLIDLDGEDDEGEPIRDTVDDSADNTHGLPAGKPLEDALKRFFKKQLIEVLKNLGSSVGVEPPSVFAKLANYNDLMASAMTPILSAYWDAAGKDVRARMGLDPDEWRVADPNTKTAIEDAAFAFCEATNETTTLALTDAHAALRKELIEGVVEAGESVRQLTERVKSVFTNASDYRAKRIAQTETSRAVHAASLKSAIDSGVASGKRWLLSANACPLCLRLKAEADAAGDDGVSLDGEFGSVGNDSIYSSIVMPPAHPYCRCSVTFVLTQEYRDLLPPDSPIPDQIPVSVAASER